MKVLPGPAIFLGPTLITPQGSKADSRYDFVGQRHLYWILFASNRTIPLQPCVKASGSDWLCPAREDVSQHDAIAQRRRRRPLGGVININSLILEGKKQATFFARVFEEVEQTNELISV